MKNDITNYEYIWRCCYQICAWEKGRNYESFPIVFGCGFMLKDNTDLIFVTADHVIHNNDFEIGERTDKEYDYAIPTNIVCKKQLGSVLVTIPGFYSFEEYNFCNYIGGGEKLEVALIPELKDLAFSRFNNLKYPILTENLSNNGNTLVQAGLQKFFITEEAFAKPNSNKMYIVMGSIKNDSKDGIHWNKCHVIHDHLFYAGTSDGLFAFKSNNPINLDFWRASPLFLFFF